MLYNMRHALHLDMPLVNLVYNETESISFLGPKIWDIPIETKEMRTVEEFKGAIKNGSPKIAHVNFVNAI